MSNKQIPVDVELPEETSTLAQVAALKSQQKNLLSTTINGGVQLELSDGIGIAKAVISREVITELELYKWIIAKGSVLVIRGLIFR
jgi:hypothetical protein